MDFFAKPSIKNRSVPASTVIPILSYKDVGQAVEWLCRIFGFKERLRIGSHRAQLTVGDGAVIVRERLDAPGTPPTPDTSRIHVHVEDAQRHYEYVRAQGAHILQPPIDHPYGERQYSVEDLGGHIWNFSESLADVDPREWGGTLVDQGNA